LAKILVVALALYGVAWFVQAEEILIEQCEARMGLVLRESWAAEQAGDWLAAAHGFAHLIAHGPATDFGCRSPEMTGGAWQLPLWMPLLRARFPRMAEDMDDDRWARAYAVNLGLAEEAIRKSGSAKSDPAASSSHDPARR
jgi:hypothetical protein